MDNLIFFYESGILQIVLTDSLIAIIKSLHLFDIDPESSSTNI